MCLILACDEDARGSMQLYGMAVAHPCVALIVDLQDAARSHISVFSAFQQHPQDPYDRPPQRQQHTQSSYHPSVPAAFEAPPSTIVLRPEPPISQVRLQLAESNVSFVDQSDIHPDDVSNARILETYISVYSRLIIY
jgi:hypothetical protein